MPEWYRSDLPTGTWNRLKTVAIAAGLITLTLALAIVLLSVALLPEASWVVRILLIAFCALAVARPADAVLVTTALIGFGIILSHLAGIPLLRTTDVLIAASLFGCCLRTLPRGSALRSGLNLTISIPIVLFAITAIASTVVWLRVYQTRVGTGSAYAQAVLQFVTHDYFVRPGEFWLVISTVAILQGLALYVAVAAWSRVDETFFDRGARMLTIGGAGVAMMSVVRLVEIYLRNPQAINAMRATYDGLRISPQIPDYIAAGSYFSLCWLVALGLAIASARNRLVWAIPAAVLLAGLYLTGSRSVIGAALGGLVVLIFILFVRQRVRVFRGVIAVAAIALVILIASFGWLIGHDVAGEKARASLSVRGELLRVGLHVIETRPLFGVGLDRFFLVAGAVQSPLLDAAWAGRRNPHNDFLRFAAELGLVGVGLFLWILAAVAARVWRALRASSDARLAGLLGGIVAFLITGMVSNPLMLREVSYVFWIALGLAMGHSMAVETQSVASGASTPAPASARWTRFQLAAASALGAVLVVSIPFRVNQEIRTLDPASVSYGLSDWETDLKGTRFRWSGEKATVFVSGRARRVEIPVSGTLPAAGLQHVKVRLDGRLINDMVVGTDWQLLGIVLLGGDSTTPRRVDLEVSPTWTRSDVTANDEHAVVGVKLGELNVIR